MSKRIDRFAILFHFALRWRSNAARVAPSRACHDWSACRRSLGVIMMGLLTGAACWFIHDSIEDCVNSNFPRPTDFENVPAFIHQRSVEYETRIRSITSWSVSSFSIITLPRTKTKLCGVFWTQSVRYCEKAGMVLITTLPVAVLAGNTPAKE
jgi:hypothetical protein